MIAIAGAKGGSGKTTTTLGLAEAFGRGGTTALAIDADRQLPNLHVVAGVDRSPTLASLTPDDEITTVSQQSPRVPNARILPAPTPSEQVDLRSAFDRLELAGDSIEVFVDCPSGAGPDVVEPVSIADGVIVVTTGTERSVVAAETTIDIAHRLEVPIVGVVCNRCETVPSTLEARLGVEVLGALPDHPSPLMSDTVCEAFDDVVATLERLEYCGSTAASDRNRLATGIDALDAELDGGLPPGSVVALTADPASQSEHLLYRMTAVRGTLYLTTERSVANVTRAIDVSTVDAGKPTIRRLDDEKPLKSALELLEKLPDGANVVVDSIDALERSDRRAYLDFLDELADRMLECEGLAVLYCLRSENELANRTSTKHLVDAVFDVHTTTPGWDANVNHSLSVSKYRFDSSVAETIDLTGELEPEPGERVAGSKCS